jgi:hypothetical protein
VKLGLGALVLILVAACSSDGGSSDADTTPTPSPKASKTKTPPDSELPPRKRLKAAKLALSRATSGAYDLNVRFQGLDDMSIRERGQFNVPDEVIDIVRTVQTPARSGEETTSHVIRWRSSAGAQFMQMDDWGPWEGCWGEFGPELTRELGVDVSALPNIPVPVSLVLDARLTSKNRPAMVRPGGVPSIVPAASTPAADEITATTDGFTALQMLGVGGSVLFDLDPAVARARVPVQLRYHHRYTETIDAVTLRGADAVEALRSTDATLDRELAGFMGSAHAFAQFSEAGSSVKFLRPAPDRLLPDGATRDQTCPANLD